MPYKILMLDHANKQFTETIEWYLEQQNGVADRFIKQFEKEVIIISEHPESYPKIKKTHHQALMSKFPYVILYSINKKKEIINISAIFHTSRNPNKKFRK